MRWEFPAAAEHRSSLVHLTQILMLQLALDKKGFIASDNSETLAT